MHPQIGSHIDGNPRLIMKIVFLLSCSVKFHISTSVPNAHIIIPCYHLVSSSPPSVNEKNNKKENQPSSNSHHSLHQAGIADSHHTAVAEADID